jgi:hypothetical protein
MVDGMEWVFAFCAFSFVAAGFGFLNAAYILISERRERGPSSPARHRTRPQRRA